MRAGLGAAGDSLKQPQWQDGSGHVIDPPSTVCRTCSGPAGKESELFVSKPDRWRLVMPRDLKLPKCGPGVSILIPANSVLDASGNPATAPFDAAVSTVDLLSPQQMPGDYSVIPNGGGGGNIESFGAGSLDLPPGFKLRAGALAKVTIRIDRSRLMAGALPASVPLVSYDEIKGLWMEEGTLNLTTVNGVKSYQGFTKHFSTFNADNVKDPTSACLRVFSEDFPVKYDLEVSSPVGDGTGIPRVVTHEIDQTMGTQHAIYNLPNNSNITLAPMTKDLLGSGGEPPQLLGFYVVNSGQPQVPNTSPYEPPFVSPEGYASCKNFVVLKRLNAPDSPFGGEFLHGLGYLNAVNLGFNDLTSAGVTGNLLRDTIAAASRSYYAAVDPNPPADNRDTFDKFKAALPQKCVAMH